MTGLEYCRHTGGLNRSRDKSREIGFSWLRGSLTRVNFFSRGCVCAERNVGTYPHVVAPDRKPKSLELAHHGLPAHSAHLIPFNNEEPR